MKGFISHLTYFLAAGAVSLGIGFFALASALWFLICKRREIFEIPKVKSTDVRLKEGPSKSKVEKRDKEATEIKAVNSEDELCLPDSVGRESPEITSVANGSSVTLSVSSSASSSYCSQSVEAADDWYSDNFLEAKKPPEPLVGDPLAEKVLAYLSTISLEEWPGNAMNVTSFEKKDDIIKEMFTQRNAEVGIHNLQYDTE